MNIPWTPEQIAELTRLHASPLTYTKIGEALGTTRSAVSGEVRRLGLPCRTKSERKPDPPKPAKSALGQTVGSRHAVSPTHTPEPIPTPPVKLADATAHQCRYPHEVCEFPDLYVCGAPGYPWCPKHRKRVYAAPVRRAG